MKIIRQLFLKMRTSNSYLLINIVGLSTAFAAFTLIILFVINELQFDKFNTKGKRIFRIELNGENQVPLVVSRLSKERLPEVENSVVIKSFDNHWISYEKNFFDIDEFCFAENSFFEIFTIPFVYGDYKTALNGPFTIVLTESVSKKIFGNINPIGKQVNFKNQNYYTVTGVIKDLPDFHLPVKAIASFKSLEDIYHLTNENLGWSFVSYVLLNENSKYKDLEIKMNSLFINILGSNKKTVKKPDFALRPFYDIYLASDTQGNDETKHGDFNLLIIMIVSGILIIGIAGINFVNLSISRRLKECHKIYIRKILGGTTKSIIFQYTLDAVMLCTLSLLTSFIIVYLCYHIYENLIGKTLNIYAIIKPHYMFFLISGIIVFGAACGFLPAYYLTREKSGAGLARGLTVKKRMNFNAGLITFQYTISVMLICGTLLTYKQLHFMRNKNPGFNKDGVLAIELTTPIKDNLNSFKNILLENPDISEVSFVSDEITQLKQYSILINIDGEDHLFKMAFIDPSFLKLLEIDLITGNNFSWDIPTQITDNYIINEAAWDILKNSAIDKEGYKINGRKLLGVTNNLHIESLRYKVSPMIFYWGKSSEYNKALLKLTNGNYANTLAYINGVYKKLAPDSMCKYKFLDESIYQLSHPEEMIVRILGIFSLLALILASMGIISLSFVTAENRTKEIGIRKINGARVGEIVTMLSTDFIKWVAIAYLIACPIAWFGMHYWLQNFTYRTKLSLWIFVLAGILVMIIALLTVIWQSWHAATRNPVEALRYE
jgi:putative ABC transport system permease protein